MLTGEELKALVILPIASAGSLYAGFRMLGSGRKIQDMPSSRIGTAAQGQVEFQGYAWPAEQVLKRSTGQPCVHYWWQVERYEKQGKNSRWVTVYKERSLAVPFVILDETAAALVDIQQSSVNTACQFWSWSKLSEAQKKYFSEAVGSNVTGFPPLTGLFSLFAQKYRIVEYFIPIGTPLFALGHFESPADYPLEFDMPGLHHFVARVRRLKGQTKTLSTLLDSDGDGKISAEELNRGFHAAAISALGAKGELPKLEPFRIQGRLTSSSELKCKIHLGDQEQALKSLSAAWVWLTLGAIGVTLSILLIIKMVGGRPIG